MFPKVLCTLNLDFPTKYPNKFYFEQFGGNILQEIYLQLGAELAQGQPQMGKFGLKFWSVELFEWFVFHIAIYLSLALQNTGSFGIALVSD